MSCNMTNEAAVHLEGAEHSVRLDVAVLFPLKSQVLQTLSALRK